MADSRFSPGVPLQLPTSQTSPVPRSSGPQPDLGSGAVCTGLGSASPPTKSHLPGPEGVGPGQSIQRRWASLGTAGSERAGLALHPFSKAGSGLEWRHQVPTPKVRLVVARGRSTAGRGPWRRGLCQDVSLRPPTYPSGDTRKSWLCARWAQHAGESPGGGQTRTGRRRNLRSP